jgi:hypothetical protein
MKHSLVLLLGLTSLSLSSAPAYANYSSESLDFDPLHLAIDRPHQLAQKSSEALPRSQRQNSSIEMRQSDIDTNTGTSTSANTRKQIDQTKKNSDLDRSVSAETSTLDSPSPRQISESDRTHPLNATDESPFQLSDDLTDAELFEEEAISDPIDPAERSELATRPGVEFESPDAEFERLFESLQPQPAPRLPQLTDRPHDLSEQNSYKSEHQTDNRSADRSNDRSRTLTIESSEQDAEVSDKSSLGLNFNLTSPDPPSSPPLETAAISPAISPVSPTPQPVPSQPESAAKGSSNQDELEKLFVGESDSIVAIAVGSAEGTRSPDGGKNPAYQGHTDPGNGVWNLGSFSYQHGASSPEEADVKQLARLRTQAKTIFDKAASQGLNLTLEEKLNGIDLANQAPKAALDEFGYIDRLAEAYARGLTGSDAILWARVQSFIDPRTQTWDAPGLGNSEDRITRDQERRMIAITKAIANYLQEIANRPSQKPSEDQSAQKSRTQPTGIAQLFTQPFINLFASTFSEVKTDVQTELPIVQQILSLNLSA